MLTRDGDQTNTTHYCQRNILEPKTLIRKR